MNRTNLFNPSLRKALLFLVLLSLTLLPLTACSDAGNTTAAATENETKNNTKESSHAPTDDPSAQTETTEEPTEEPTNPLAPPDIELTALSTEKLSYIIKDFWPTHLDPFSKTEVLVIYIEYTDGDAYNEAAVKECFEGDYDSDHRLGSVNAYYTYNSGVQDLFNFHYYSYHTGLSCEEAWHYINDEDENGNYVGPMFMYEIYDAIKAAHPDEFNSYDTDQDGWIDSAVFISGEHQVSIERNGQVSTYYILGGASGTTSRWIDKPIVGDPAFRNYCRLPFTDMVIPLAAGKRSNGVRVLLHEVGHMYGAEDYYDSEMYQNVVIDTLGEFDMHADDLGDLNVFTRMAIGWLDPYILPADFDEITVKLKAGETILLPTSLGWNGTAFDEYVLIDVLGKTGANGYDWEFFSLNQDTYVSKKNRTRDGGVRIYHVDARLLENHLETGEYTLMTDPAAAKARYDDGETILSYLNVNSNGYEKKLSNASRFWHCIDIVPADGSDRFWNITKRSSGGWYDTLSTDDLFGYSEVFSMETCGNAFPENGKMNNGGTFDYSVKVEYYDAETCEAIITITKNK